MSKPFPFNEFESQWQKRWEDEKTYRTPNPGDTDFDPSKPKYFVLDMFPYPSGAGLHVGHPEGYTATDIIGRYKRMNGFNVLHPMGWDAFGLPAEQYAIKTGQHPRITTEANTDNFKAQLKRLGFAYDWDREINTTDPEYVRWTQWIFLQLYGSYFCEDTQKAQPISQLEEKGWSTEQIDEVRLAFIHEAPVNWSPSLGTVLANEEVDEWKAKGETVERRPLRQWMLRITKYAQRLIDDLEPLDWPDSIKALQRNWIGKSEGAEVTFDVEGNAITIFTTRPDTLFGATYMVLAPEHPLVAEITTADQKARVEDYIKTCAGKSDLERGDLNKDKSGVPTGAHAINPVNGEKIPVWIADYVMMGYGTGAIMAVPAHDERDKEFAFKFDLPIKPVVADKDGHTATSDHGTAINSDFLNGLKTSKAKTAMIAWLEEKGLGKKQINFKLRDWLFSRQRYWGEPFPLLWDKEGNHHPLPESELPLLQPEMEDFKPTGDPRGPLLNAKDWIKYSDTLERETNTMPQWAGSCWYYMRYCDPSNKDRFISKEAEQYWGSTTSTAPSSDGNAKEQKTEASAFVDLYIGGTEHAVLHLLYARFWHKVLHDLGHLDSVEPFKKLVNQGLILGTAEYFQYKTNNGSFISYKDIRYGDDAFPHKVEETDIEWKGTEAFKKGTDLQLELIHRKMSKGFGNVVNPDTVVQEYGADSLRLYEMFMGPLEQVKPWQMKGVEGVSRFLAKVWRLAFQGEEGNWTSTGKIVEGAEPTKALLKVLHETIKKVGEDIERLSFNTAISQMMICTKAFQDCEVIPKEEFLTFLKLLNPFAPHLTEELNVAVTSGEEPLLSEQQWPTYDEALMVESEATIIIQVNGKLRSKLTVPKDMDKADLEQQALAEPNVLTHTDGKTIRKVIVIPNKLVNIVAN